ncbi:MAG: hypothetical protein NVS3B6_11230 [Pseudarthrobacter sp.]
MTRGTRVAAVTATQATAPMASTWTDRTAALPKPSVQSGAILDEKDDGGCGDGTPLDVLRVWLLSITPLSGPRPL